MVPLRGHRDGLENDEDKAHFVKAEGSIRDAAAIGVGLLPGYVKLPYIDNDLRGEGFVELNEVQVLDRQPCVSQN